MCLGACLCNRNARLQSSDDSQIVAVAFLRSQIVTKCHESLNVRRNVYVLGKDQAEIFRHHSDNGEDFAISLHGLAHDLWVGSKSATPEPVPENDRGRGALEIVLRVKQAPARRRNAKQGKKIACHEAELDLLRLAHAGDGGATHPNSFDVLE